MNSRYFLYFLFFILFTLYLPMLPLHAATSVSGNSVVNNFDAAKKILQNQIYNDATWRVDFYCHCPYSEQKVVDQKACGYKVNNPRKADRAGRIEWEHIVPAHAFGQSFKEWRDGHADCVKDSKKKGKSSFKGRECARKTNETFRLMEADLYNLVPAVGEVNADRENFSYADLSTEAKDQHLYGACPVRNLHRKFEPADSEKGMAARTYLYMNAAYPGHGIISQKNEKLFEAWNKKFPVTEKECSMAEKIAAIQKNINPFVSKPCEELKTSKKK